MDEASRLVSELHSKLAELDQKVWQYRRDMATEFTKYKEDVLRNVPKEISDTVSETIAGQMKNYKSLNPSTADVVESCQQTGTSILSHGPENAAPSYFTNTINTNSYRRSDAEMDSPRSPHERELEFQGVFTPSYLPLLDSTSRNERRSSYEQFSPSLDKGKEREMDSSAVDASTDTRSLAASPEFRRPSTPKRRNTDEVSVISATSDDGPIRRSALRRSSSTKAQSPRRVRFDFAGSEVLPNASPLPHQSILGTDIPPSPRGLLDDSDGEAESEQIEDIDSPPPPKRISSSQALRVLSRKPLEDDSTVWTTVSAPPDGSASVEGGSPEEEDPEEEKENNDSPTAPVNIPEPSPIRSAYNEPVQTEETKDDTAETVSDDEMLDMPPLKRAQNSGPTILSPIHVPGNTDNTTPTSTTRSPNKPWLTLESFDSKKEGEEENDIDYDEDIDEIFHFGDPVEDHRSPPEDEDSESDSPLSPALEHAESFARSPPRSIPPRDVHKPAPAPVKGVVGSYKGRQFGMPIVSDEIHAQAASLGAMNSFVGSVNGRSGMDESDVQSFRESFRITGSYKAGFNATGHGSFSGAPKSMTERMMMDDLMEAEENTKKP